MTPAESLGLLSNVTSQIPMVRADNQKTEAALTVFAETIQRLAATEAELAKAKAEIASLKQPVVLGTSPE